jgi:hypothetical protein
MVKKATIILTVLLTVLSVLSGAHAVFAQAKKGKGSEVKESKKKKKKPTEEDKLAAKSFTEKGMGLYVKGDYEGALVYLLKADALVETSVNLFYIAKCYDVLYQYREAYAYYQKYIDTGEKANYDVVIEAIARIESMPGIVKVVTTPEGAVVSVDGKEVTFQKTPMVCEVESGSHIVLIHKDGFKDVTMNVDVPFAGEERIDVELQPIKQPAAFPDETKEKAKGEPKETPEEQPKEQAKQVETIKKTPPGEAGKPLEKAEPAGTGGKPAQTSRPVPMSISLAVGATVSTTRSMGSYIDASLGIFFRIRGGFVGLGLDNLFFTDGYLLAAYAAGGYTLTLWRDLSMSFAAGIGPAYLYAAVDGGDEDGNVLIRKGSYRDLVVHADIRLRYKVGPVILLAIPACADVLVGVGDIEPAPLAQFAFLLGAAFDF